jgi:protein-arginine kinase activator protein McsA
MGKSNINLIKLFKLFKNRPNHLVKFLIDADAFNSNFLKKIESNSSISDVDESKVSPYFRTIDDMKDYYSSFLQEVENGQRKKTKEELLEELTNKIKEACEKENYEEAARIRDYIIKNNLKKK